MRKLKFRYWNGISKMMVNEPEMPYKKDWTITQLFSERGWVWMQFTGLLDKQGKEIFEGDILGENLNSKKWNSGESERIVVKYNDKLTRFLCYFYTVFGGEGYSGNSEGQQLCDYVKAKWYVIGNKWENPELLK